ncbi:MAG: beta-lactamase family protein [Clostridiaceae bacterium]|nr:beta-lactamase family protein [Clostridiaceae bacterium]
MKKRFSTFLIITLLITILISISIIKTPSLGGEKNLSEVIEKYITTYRIPGVEVAVAKDDKIIYSKGFGNTPEGTQVTADTPMYIGSVSKSFTALAILQLVERDKINLDSPVVDYLPWFKVKGFNNSKHITVRHLLNHTSGLSEETYFKELPVNTSLEAAVENLAEAELVEEPGKVFNYFNPNYQVLGLIIEKVAEISYDEYVKKHILEPLSMKNTYLTKEEIEKKVTKGFSSFFTFPFIKSEPFRPYGLPEGYIVSTAKDMILFLQAHSNLQSDLGQLILSKDGFKQLQTPDSAVKSNYAMGWQRIKSSKGYTVVYNGGDLDTYHSDVMIIPEKGYSIVIMINQNSFINQLVVYDSLRKAVIDFVLGNEEQQDMPAIHKYLIIAGIAIVAIIVYQLCSIICIVKRAQICRYRKKTKIILSIFNDCLLPVILLIVVPKLVSVQLERGVTLREAFNMQPDMTVSIIIISILFCIKAITKIVFMVRD